MLPASFGSPVNFFYVVVYGTIVVWDCLCAINISMSVHKDVTKTARQQWNEPDNEKEEKEEKFYIWID